MKPLLFTLYFFFVALIILPLYLLHYFSLGILLLSGMMLSWGVEWVSEGMGDL